MKIVKRKNIWEAVKKLQPWVNPDKLEHRIVSFYHMRAAEDSAFQKVKSNRYHKNFKAAFIMGGESHSLEFTNVKVGGVVKRFLWRKGLIKRIPFYAEKILIDGKE
jgi:putative intracellular protease/amidase